MKYFHKKLRIRFCVLIILIIHEFIKVAIRIPLTQLQMFTLKSLIIMYILVKNQLSIMIE